jgi:hypothetical protein
VNGASARLRIDADGVEPVKQPTREKQLRGPILQ